MISDETIHEESRGFLRRPGVFLGAILIFAFVLRVVVSAMAYASTFDTATPGLMALHILKGARPLFFYGQEYMGALEAYVAALMFRLFGVSDLSLSLSPILFSVGWIAGTYLLFRELIDARAGLAAALVVAVPGWHAMWYSIGSYGGYPGTFCFGTWSLWLCLRLAARRLSAREEWGHVLSLGLLAGLALWTNYQSASYLATGAVLILICLVRARFSLRLLGKFAVGGVFFALGVLPALRSFAESEGGGRVAQYQWTLGYIKHTMKFVAKESLPEIVFPPLEMTGVLEFAVAACVVLACALYIVRMVRAANASDRLRVLVPALFCAIFLVLFLPHSMASVRAPRYLIPLWMMLTCAAFAVPVTLRRTGLRRMAWALLSIWLAFTLTTDVMAAREESTSKKKKVARRQRLVANARSLGARNVVMIGGHVFGYTGQILSLYARDEIHFTSVFGERYQPAAQEAETGPGRVLACEASKLAKVAAALDDLGAAYEVLEDKWVCLLHSIRVPHTERRAVPVAEMRVRLGEQVGGDPAYLIDRAWGTSVEGPFEEAGSITIDLGRRRMMESIWLMTSDEYRFRLPEAYEVSVSRNGRRYERIKNVDRRIAVAYTCGDQVYMKGYHGWLESRFEPVRCRFIRIDCTRAQGSRSAWNLNEVYAFEYVGDGVPYDEEAEAIARFLEAQGVDFTVCDRWLSARLSQFLPASNGAWRVFPRFNPKYSFTQIDREVVPRQGLAIAVDKALEHETAGLLSEIYGDGCVESIESFPHYSVFLLREPVEQPVAGAPKLVWAGATLLKTVEPEQGD